MNELLFAKDLKLMYLKAIGHCEGSELLTLELMLGREGEGVGCISQLIMVYTLLTEYNDVAHFRYQLTDR